MKSKIIPTLLAFMFTIGLAGCNFPLTRNAGQPASGSPEAANATLAPQVETQSAADFDPLSIDCLVGTWEVDNASLLYAGNMLVGDTGLSLTNISPHIYYRISWNDPQTGSAYTMETWFVDSLISGAITLQDSEHTLDLVLNGSATASFSAGPAAGEFNYQNDPNRASLKISSLKLDGKSMPVELIPLKDFISAVPSSTMYYSCKSSDVIILRDQNAVDGVTLNRVSDDTLPAAK